jgi:hypothetical protein
MRRTSSVAGNWSIRIRRGDRAFPVVLDVIAARAVPADVVRRLRLDDLDDAGGDDAYSPVQLLYG